MPLVPASPTSGCAGRPARRPAGPARARGRQLTEVGSADHNTDRPVQSGLLRKFINSLISAEWRVTTSSAAMPVIKLNRAVSLMDANAKQSRSGAHEPTADPHRRAGE